MVSNFASPHPDGLDSSLLKGCTVNADGEITGGSCPAQQARHHELADSPLADYGIRGIDNRFLSTGLSGVLGVLLTFALGGGLFWLLAAAAATPAGRGRRHGHRSGAGTAAPAGGRSGRGPRRLGRLRGYVAMGAGHAHVLYREHDSPVHRLPPEVKIAAMVLFTVAVVATPRQAFWAFGGYAAAGRRGGGAGPGRSALAAPPGR